MAEKKKAVDHSVVIHIPLPKSHIRKPSEVSRHDDRTPFNRFQDKYIMAESKYLEQKYSLPGERPINLKIIQNDKLLLFNKRLIKCQESYRCKRRLEIPLKDKYKIVSTNLRQRLQEDKLVDDVTTITSANKDFFKIVDGRPLFHHIPMFKTLKTVFGAQLRVRQEIGYRTDIIMNIEVRMRKELEIYNSSVKKCASQAKYFDFFIMEDYQNSMEYLRKSETLRQKLDAMTIELQCLANKRFTIVSNLIGLDYKYRIQQKYGRFLYYLSPPIWRSKRRDFARSIEIEALGFDLGSSDEDSTFLSIFEKMKNEFSSKIITPVLFFSKPKDLMDVFESFEKQQLHHFTHVTHLTPHAKKLNEGIEMLKRNIVKESASVANSIATIEKLVEFSENRCAELENKFFRILNEMLYHEVGSPEALKLYVHLQFCCERLSGDKSFSADVLTLAKYIEQFYLDFNKRLDAIKNDSVRRAVDHSNYVDKKKLKNAHLAVRELRRNRRLYQELLRATAPAPKKDRLRRDKVHVKYPLQQKLRGLKKSTIVETQVKRRELTESEKEYLVFFTEWTENEDASLYLKDFENSDMKLL